MAPKDTHPSNLTDAKWDHGSTDGEIFLVIRDGAGPKFEMKGYKAQDDARPTSGTSSTTCAASAK